MHHKDKLRVVVSPRLSDSTSTSAPMLSVTEGETHSGNEFEVT